MTHDPPDDAKPNRADATVVVRALTDEDRAAVAQWRYAGALSIYNPGAGASQLRAPDHVALAGADGEFLGYGTLGAEAQVPGGRYDSEAEAVDLGVGLRPDLVGRGHGRAALLALMAEARVRREPAFFRTTVAAQNARASALVLHSGFHPTHRFCRPSDHREFVQYERPADSELSSGA